MAMIGQNNLLTRGPEWFYITLNYSQNVVPAILNCSQNFETCVHLLKIPSFHRGRDKS